MALTDADIKTDFAAVMQVAEANLASLWDAKITDARDQANNVIESILIGERGFTVAQVAAWDSLDDNVRSHSLFLLLQFARPQGVPWEQIMSWDIRKELRKVNLVDTAGDPVTNEEEPAKGDALDDGAWVPTDTSDPDFEWGD